MMYIYSKYRQRGESYAYELGMSPSDYRVVSQPQNACGDRYNRLDKIVVVGEVSDQLWGMIELNRRKVSEAPIIDRVWVT